MVNRRRFGGGVQKPACGGGVADGGGVVEAEDRGEVQRVGAAGQGLVELTVDAETLEGGVQPAERRAEPVLADRSGAHRGLVVDDQVWVRGVWPANAPVVEPGEDETAGEVVERPGLPGDGDPPVTKIDIVEGEVSDGLGPGGVNGGQGEGEPGGWGDGDLRGRADLGWFEWKDQGVWPGGGTDAGGGVGEDQAGLLAVPGQ
ncbi:MAG: hypothetical protein GEV03_28465 [Streptosporangiales bacterium]|nr:hypothetical protein [Streptosporangiales bacterium]